MLFLKGIGIKTAKKEPLISTNEVTVSLEKGMKGDIRGEGGRTRRRQITVISMNQWRETCSDMGWNPYTTSWMLRRAGLCIEGLWFLSSHVGQHMSIGDEVVLEITEENPACDVMDMIKPGLKDVLNVGLRAGVACRVIRGGRVATGNRVVLFASHPR